MQEQFNLDRHINEQNNIDPTGKKWVIHTTRGSSLVYARPDPDAGDRAIIPKEFHGKWTSIPMLQQKIKLWLKAQWDKSEEASRRNALRAGRTAPVEEEAPVVKQTPEESLEALPDEVKEALSEELTVTEEAPKASKKVSKKKVAKK